MDIMVVPTAQATEYIEVGSFLFNAGYSAERLDDDTAAVRDPCGQRFLVDMTRMTCSCQKPGTTIPVPCMHVLGCAGLLSEQDAFEEAMIAEMEAQCDAWAVLESDRTDRLLREIGVTPL